MNRPYIFCYMMTSLDGKIMGKYMETPEGSAAGDVFYNISFGKKLFGIETLMLGGGGVLNWSFIQAGMCDEVSVVIAAAADGSTNTPALFSAKGGFAPEMPVCFSLQSAEVRNGGSVWLRYLVKEKE
ncbi:dihydrofolate reductase family protein [Marvinbryantia formatexigens DSM 14469]|nr:dihydrofolate reductase family protein [Marvinbryantia formatexigens]UWO25793.1 dihydrofolate reductase family protein [Marvinbryantia formatexigens DSM 14469]SDF37365.1 RibD C-terminal domain-containing protein [Marvinbryantia formatexigens]